MANWESPDFPKGSKIPLKLALTADHLWPKTTVKLEDKESSDFSQEQVREVAYTSGGHVHFENSAVQNDDQETLELTSVDHCSISWIQVTLKVSGQLHHWKHQWWFMDVS